jgi:phage terminase large subunit-like protein
MARKLKPCGTYAAYCRHLRNNEKACGPCLEANRERASAAPSGFTNYEREMAKALEANPPRIVWRKDKYGVSRAVSIDDPHAERTPKPEFHADYYEPECTDETLLAAGTREI